jgi:hypothetical protein
MKSKQYKYYFNFNLFKLIFKVIYGTFKIIFIIGADLFWIMIFKIKYYKTLKKEKEEKLAMNSFSNDTETVLKKRSIKDLV